MDLYFVDDGTEKAGMYECCECHMRYLSISTEDAMECPYCDKDFDMEIGPDEEMPVPEKTAKLIKIVEGKDQVGQYDKLLSLAITGGDYEWL